MVSIVISKSLGVKLMFDISMKLSTTFQKAFSYLKAFFYWAY